MTVDGVPGPLAAEILQQYGDVLRVGRVNINGSEVCWSTSGSTPTQMDAFSKAFCGALRLLPESAGLDDSILRQSVYWFCKVVSINYALCEVLDHVKEKVGKQCSISTSGQGGRCIINYGVVLRPDHTMEVFLSWSEKGNIVFCDPKTAKKKVKGTLSSLVTDFCLPPDPSFMPTYSVQMKLKRSYKQKLMSKVASFAKKRKPTVSPQILLDSPLHSPSSINLGLEKETSTACSTEAPSTEVSLDGDSLAPTRSSVSLLSNDVSDSEDEEGPSSVEERFAPPLHFQARSVIGRVSSSPSDGSVASLRGATRAPGFSNTIRAC